MRSNETFFYVACTIAVALWTADAVLDLNLFQFPTDEKIAVQSVSFSQVQPIFKNRCLKCHSAHNWDWTNYDVAYAKRDRIKSRVWTTRSMPLGSSDITEDERRLIRDWVDSGASK